MNIIGCRDDETRDMHLAEWPLAEGWTRHYYDHTGRFFKDYSPEEWERATRPNPISEAIEAELKKQIDAEIISRLRGFTSLPPLDN